MVQKRIYDIMILTEMKIHEGVYFQNRLECNVSCLTATEGNRVKGGVGILSLEFPEGCLIKSM